MAISVDSTTNLNLIDAAEATTGWSFSGMTKTALSTASREGTNCIGGQVALSTYGYAYHTHSTSVNMTTAGNERVYIWAKNGGAGTVAQDGWMVWIGDGTNARAYTVGGSDAEPFGAKGWYCLMLDTANFPTTYQQTDGSAEPDLTAITQFGFGTYNVVAPSGNALNVFVDVVRYGSGLVVTSGIADDISLADLAADDFSSATGKAYGIIREFQPGIFSIQGDILLGDTSGNSIDWKETDAVVIFEDRVAGAGTNTKFQLSGQHSATGSFRAELGIAVISGDSESGRSGVVFVSANPANQPIDFDFSDSDIEDVFLYGCSFIGMRNGNIKFSADATNGVSHHVSGCNFSACAQIDPGVIVVRNCNFSATDEVSGSLLWNESINIKNSNFRANTDVTYDPHAILHTASGIYDYDGLFFSDNDYDIALSGTAGTDYLTINSLNNSDPGTYEVIVGSGVSILNSVFLTINVENSGGIAISGVAVAVYTASGGVVELMNEYTSPAGQAQESYNYLGTMPISIRLRKSSTGDTRYFPITAVGEIGSTGFTLTAVMSEDIIAA